MRYSSIGARLAVLGVFLCGLLIGGLIITDWLVLPRASFVAAQGVPTAVPTPTLPPDTVFAQVEAMDQVMTNLYQRVSPSVVHISSRLQRVAIFTLFAPTEGTGIGVATRI